MRRRTAVWLLLLFAGQPAVAQDHGWFVTAQLGVAEYETTQKGPGGFWGVTDDSAFSWALGLGYAVNERVAIRGMFERSTGHTTTNRCPGTMPCPPIFIQEQADFHNLSLVAMPRMSIGPRTSLYATMGLQYWDADGGPELPSDDGFEFLFGGGLDYSLDGGFSLGAEVQGSTADYLAGRVGIRYSW